MDIVERLRSARPCTQFDSAGRLVTFDGEPTDMECKAADEIERLRDLVRCLVENDPNDYAADAVTVLDVWRNDARKALGMD